MSEIGVVARAAGVVGRQTPNKNLLTAQIVGEMRRLTLFDRS